MIKRISFILLLSIFSIQPALAADGLDFLNKANKLLEEKKRLKEKASEGSRKNSLEGAQESRLVAKYPGSILNAQQTNDLTRVVLPLSSNLRSDTKNYKKLKLSGEQSVYIYDVPTDVSKSYFKVFNTLKENLKEAGFKNLWECDSADKNCGYFFPRQFVFTDRGEDSSKIFNAFDGLTNFVDGNSDYAIYTGKTLHRNQTYFITLIVGQYSSKVQYSFEIVKADDPMQDAGDDSTTGDTAAETPRDDKLKPGLGVAFFPGAKITAEHSNDLTRVVFPISGNLRNQEENYKKLKLTGVQQVQIFNIPANVSKSYLKVLSQMKQNLVSSGFEILWQCDSADNNCGYFFPRRFLFTERGKDASDIYHKFSGVDNFTDGNSDYGIVTAKVKYNNQTCFALLIVGSYSSEVQYSLEFLVGDDPTAPLKK
ncbi:hypothetical protein GCM10011613_19670 [Cellvibrio zantedeschiae]|uniref:Toxin co-regulated pilus biosynthesis protein Q C-terminal domain-containing protein n=1 Tax=Cellvibrio zantedeschiae TaxID=1237077 RepID=A0ABQ3B193_9GAMM|nr:hypothetical protein [Cellvibrio zantedeschiae]GGY74343.1 hypothetical protein GCM10011613_19670 [Cellvibrio zantedeschiae]